MILCVFIIIIIIILPTALLQLSLQVEVLNGLEFSPLFMINYIVDFFDQ